MQEKKSSFQNHQLSGFEDGSVLGEMKHDKKAGRVGKIQVICGKDSESVQLHKPGYVENNIKTPIPHNRQSMKQSFSKFL